MKHRSFFPTTFRNLAIRVGLALALSIGGIMTTPPGLVQAASITVTTTEDEFRSGAGCSLREAIEAANNDTGVGGCTAGSGADTIFLPAGTYTLTLPNSYNINEDNNATGDLDINSDLTITGAGSGSTIIQAGGSAGTGIDKVLAINPYCINPVNATIDGVTIRYGTNTQTFGSSDYSFTGGGLDFCGVMNSNFTLLNSVVADNTNVNGYGGGMNVDSVGIYTGTITIDHVTFLNNRTMSSSLRIQRWSIKFMGLPANHQHH